MHKYYSNGKLLLSAEYLILDGALGLALPTSYGQSMEVSKNSNGLLTWESFNEQNESWFKGIFKLNNFSIEQHVGDKNVALTLQRILQKVKSINPEFLRLNEGIIVKTYLDFPNFWGLGTSSTLINNIAQWAKVDAYQLLFESFGGSGYDIACAQSNSAILYKLKNGVPESSAVTFNPPFKEQLYFVHLNRKQVSKESVEGYKKARTSSTSVVEMITNLTAKMLNCVSLHEFNLLLAEHESILAKVLKKATVQQSLFDDFSGQTKSLGAWGGDFILATGDKQTPAYFKQKGFNTIVPYSRMIK
jgi:mevalonate kinase